MGKKGDLERKGYFVGGVNEGIGNLDLPKWAYYRHIDGRIVYLPADPISQRRNKNKGFIFFGDNPPDEPLPNNSDVINYTI